MTMQRQKGSAKEQPLLHMPNVKRQKV